MAFQRISGTSRYVNSETGETISRRQFERLSRGEQLSEREQRYSQRLSERRAARDRAVSPEVRNQNKAYWRQRYAEQYAATFNVRAMRRGSSERMSDREAVAIAKQGGSKFNRLWAVAEAQGFEGGTASAWDEIARVAGARGGEDDENERARYLAIIGWYTQHGDVSTEPYMEKDSQGHFRYPDLVERLRHRRGRVA